MADVVKVERHDRIAVLIMNRERSLNAMSIALAHAVTATLIELDGDDTVDGIVITGAGTRAFCAGVDLQEGRTVKVEDVEQWFGTVCNIYRQILLTDKPVIAAINGVAAGAGFQIALVSDCRLAQPGARLGQPEINAGIPSIMGSYWMSLHLGWSMNQDLSFTGRLLDVEEAQGLRLINHVVPPDELIPRSAEIARNFAAKPRVCLAQDQGTLSRDRLARF